MVNIDPAQAGSDAPSPDNVRPITGWTGVKVTRTGKNLFDFDARESDKYLDTITGFPINQAGYYITPYIPVKSGVPIIIPGSGSARRWLYDKDKMPVRYLANSSTQIFTPEIDGFIRVTVSTTNPNALTYQIEYDIGTDYEPYQGETYDITFPSEAGTIFGGSLEINEDGSGILTVTRKLITFDGTETCWAKYGTTSILGVGGLGDDLMSETGWLWGIGSMIPSINVSGQVEKCLDNRYCTHVNNGAGIEFKLVPTYYELENNEVTTWKAYLAKLKANGTPMQICGFLKTPQTYSLTASLITTLLGTNNIWADTGDIEVTYGNYLNILNSRLSALETHS